MIRRARDYLNTLGLSGLLAAIKAKFTNSTVLFEIKRQDCKYPFWLRIPSTDAMAYREVFISQYYDFVLENDIEVIVDAGANAGLTSIYFANKYPNAKIVAIEPEKSNFEVLKRNTAPYPNIIPILAALWNKNEKINLVDPGHGKWGFMTELKRTEGDSSGTTCHTVEGMTISKLMEDHNLEKINILKLDIEGTEREVFHDTSSWINKVDSLVVELHEDLKPGCNRSFYCGTRGFKSEWRQGKIVYLSRGSCLTKRST